MSRAFIVVADDGPGIAWQLHLLAATHAASAQSAELVILRDEFPSSADPYPPINRPYGLRQYLDRQPGDDRDVIVVLDPDMIFMRRFRPPRWALRGGALVGHDGAYHLRPDERQALSVYFAAPEDVTVPIPPLVFERQTLARVVDRWLQATHELRQDERANLALGWLCEMWAVPLAAVRSGVTMRTTALAAVPPLASRGRPAFLHYAWTTAWFDKRQYRPWQPLDDTAPKVYAPLERALAQQREAGGAVGNVDRYAGQGAG